MISTGTNTGQFLCFKFYNILITNRLISVKKLNKVRFPQLRKQSKFGCFFSVAFLLATNPLLNIAINQFSNCFNCSNEESRDKFLSTSTSISSEATIVTVISVSISSETLKLLRCKKFLPQ